MAPIHIPLLAFFLAFFLIAWLGSIMAHPLVRIRPKPSHVILGATAAIAIYSFYMSIIGLVGGLKFSFGFTVWIFLVIGAWYINYRMRWNGRQRPKMDWSLWRPPDLPTKILFWLLIIFQLVMLVNALAPFINLDCETYHYLLVREWLECGRITIIPDNGYSYYPLALEMSVAAAFSRAGEMGPEAGNLCLWFMQILLMGWLLDFCAKRGHVRVGYLLVTSVCGLFYWPVIAYSGDVDGGVALFSLAGVLSYLEWLNRRGKPVENIPPPKKKWLAIFWRWQQAGFTQLILVGLFLGTACASKYSAIPMAGLVGAHLLWLLLADGAGRKRTWVVFLGFMIFLIIPMLPWYGRNLIETGNPMFPFLRGLFGGPEPAFADDVSTWASWGLPQTVFYYLVYPFKLAWFFPIDARFPWFRLPYMYISWLFGLAPIAGILLCHRRIERIVAVFCFIFFTLVFFLMNLQTRYFLPFTILALWLVCEWLESLASSTSTTELAADSPANPGKKKTWAKWVVFLLILIPFTTQLDLVRNHFSMRLPYLAGYLDRQQYEESVWPSAAVFERANELATEEKQVCIFSLRTYRLTVPHILPPEGVFNSEISPETMLAGISERDVGYLMIDSRVRMGATILDWCVDNSDPATGIADLFEEGILDAMSELGISRGLAREILKHRGGQRFQNATGGWKWRIDVRQFTKPDMAGILKFLANVKQMEDKGYVKLLIEVQDIDPVRMDNWELYEIVEME